MHSEATWSLLFVPISVRSGQVPSSHYSFIYVQAPAEITPADLGLDTVEVAA